MAAPTLTDDQLAEILDAKSYADMQETAARFGIDLEAGVMDWEVGVEPWMLAELADHRRTLRDSERKDGMTLGEREAADRLVAQANGDLPPEQDAALPGTTPTSTSSNTPAGADAALNDFTQFINSQPTTGMGPTAATPFLTDTDIQMIFRRSGSDMAALNQYEDLLATYRANIDPEYAETFRVDLESTPDQQMARSRMRGAYVPGGAPDERVVAIQREIERLKGVAGESSYTLSQAANLLYGMTPTEIRALQRKLVDAGYFETAGGADGEPLFWGDPTDARTQSAWMNLLGDSVRTGEPVYDMLSRRMRLAEEAGIGGDRTGNVEDLPPIALTDPARIRQNADEMARSTIGRRLSDEENARLVEFIHNLQRDEQAMPTDEADGRFAQVPADQVAPDRYTDAADGTTTPGERDEQIQVDVNAQIAEYIRRENPTEAAGRDVALTYNDFTSLLAGPGRGGSF